MGKRRGPGRPRTIRQTCEPKLQKPTGPGRAPKAVDERKTERMYFTCTPKERREVERKAAKAGRSCMGQARKFAADGMGWEG